MVDKYNGNRYVKSFTCWNQLLALMFGQLSNCESWRDVVVVLESASYQMLSSWNVAKFYC
ncbi:DUF4372 domain-containing protein [Phocaeicola vulgatus]|uniref:DUF4372 domain-containing protein n=1 Tax=Phocaeicola vulgatus TaxID=821 RepID=UPI002165247A|nr:DUF4372 domain-containing protein [Phocaeicola vulgatus]MCS2749120.1 DUF4372 domain-containing protein [Phocaeicola vulgatus]